MKKNCGILILFLFLLPGVLAQNIQYNKFFKDKTLRIDYVHSGTDQSQSWAIDELLEEPHWGGSRINLIDTLGYGNYFFEAYDKSSGKLIYSHGYSTLFREWQTTKEAGETTKAFSETVIMPFPKDDVHIVFYSRDKQNNFEKQFTYMVDVDSYFVKPERRHTYSSFDVLRNGHPAKHADIVILPEGYTQQELGTFVKDCDEFADALFSKQPYKKNKNKFNIRGILAPSKESGSDIPGKDQWRETILNSSFFTFDLEHYCMTTDNKSVRDLAANAPYDQIYILINSEKYGGGAIYNHYSVSVNSSPYASRIFLHEFGHGFAALGDEYYDSEVTYNEFYPLDREPWESNLTTLEKFESKWKEMVPDSVPVPTPNKKKFEDVTGVFEGGGYVSKGVYRPAYNCIMNDIRYKGFCEVCKKAIQEMIDFRAR